MIVSLETDAPLSPAAQCAVLHWLLRGRTHLHVLRAPAKGWNVKGDRVFRRCRMAEDRWCAVEIPLHRKDPS